MADQHTINTLAVGLNLDDDPGLLVEGEYTYALGATVNNADSSTPFIENTPSFIPAGLLPSGYTILGRCNLNNGEIALLLGNGQGGSEIGSFLRNSYTKRINFPGLSFTLNHQIQVRYKLVQTGDRIIYWTDDNMPPMWMNFDRPNYTSTLDPTGCPVINVGILDLDSMRIFKKYTNPCVVVTDTPETGGIPSGGYFISTQYADGNRNGLTAWTNPIGPIAIFRGSLSKAYEYIAGDKSEVPTTKAIQISITDADISFSHMNIGIVKVVNGVKSASIVATIPTGTSSYTYSGIGNTELAISVDEIIQPAVVYDRARILSTTDNELLLGNLSKAKEFNFQPYVSAIQVQWQVFKGWSNDKVMSFKNPTFSTYMRVYRQDEVYALGLEFDLTDGTTTRSYHIPGRRMDYKTNGTLIGSKADVFGTILPSGQWDSVMLPRGDDMIEPDNLKRYEVYNTATVEGTLSTDKPDGLCEFGEMAYHESTRTYPCDDSVWGIDAGKPIRHHKFPDSTIMHIHDGESTSRAFEERVLLNYLGICLPNIAAVIATLPPEVHLSIKGWRLTVGDRTYSKSVIASGITLNARRQNWKNTKEEKDDYRIYPNYPLNDLRPDPYVIDADRAFADAGNIGSELSRAHHNVYLKDTFFFHSPDTHFKKSYLAATEMKVNVELYGKTHSFHDWVEPYPEFNEKGTDNDKAALQGVSIATYNNYKQVKQHNMRHKLKDALYVPFNSKVSGGAAGDPVWNVSRESSVLLSTADQVDDPTVMDTTRFILNGGEPTGVTNENQFWCQALKQVSRDASLYYATLKRKVPDQYGSIFDIKYLDTYSCGPNWLPSNIIFGGDTYLGSFSMKTQLVMFQNVKEFIDVDNGLAGADMKSARTIAHSVYYYRNTTSGGSALRESHMMCEDGRGGGLIGGILGGIIGSIVGNLLNPTALGYVDLALYGIPNFWAEADYNIELRYPGELSKDTFYKNLNDGSFRLQDWLTIRNIDSDNVFNANPDYSTKNELKVHDTNDPLYDTTDQRESRFATRTAYTLSSAPEDIYDNWLVFKALNYYDLPKNRGELLDINYLGNYKTIFRTESAVFMDTLFGTLESSEGQVLLGSGKLFQRPPAEVSFTDGGYGGGGSRWAFDSTPFGAFFPSPETGMVLSIAEGLTDISANKMSGWFSENLTYKLSKQLPFIPTDNPANPNGIGVLSMYDEARKLWLLTKRDYEVIDEGSLPLFTYMNARLYKGTAPVELSDTSIFRNKCWTMLYNPLSKRWVSWQPYTPTVYLSAPKSLYSINKDISQIWQHNIGPGVQEFYGIYYPFIIETVNKQDGFSQTITPTLTFMTMAIDTRGVERHATFNKAILYNQFQCSGLLNLVIEDESDLSAMYRIVPRGFNYRSVGIRVRKGAFNMSDFHDIYKHGIDPFFIENNLSYYQDKVLNDTALDYDTPFSEQALMRGKWLKCRFILDTHNQFKLLAQLVITANRVPAF